MARRWLIAVAAVGAAMLGAGATAALLFDPNSQKDRIVTAVGRATGRTLTLGGPIRLGWGLTPVLEAEDVSFANMPGGTRPQMAVVARAEARVRLLPLLTGQVEIASVTLVRPDILLETDASGHANWQFDHPASPAPAAPSQSARHRPPLLDRLLVESGRVTWHDGATGRTLVVDLPHAALDAGDQPAHLLADAQAGGAAVRLDATLGSVAQVTGSVPGPWPVKLSAAIGNATLALDGVADPAARSVTGRLEAAVPDLRSLGTILQHPDWPPLHAVHLGATLLGNGGAPQDVSLTVGASDLGAVLPGLSLEQLALAWPAGHLARVQAGGTLAGAPWRFSTDLAPLGQGAAFHNLAFASGLGDAEGDLAVTLAPRPALRGTLNANRLDVDAIRRLQPAPATPAPPTAAAAAAPPSPAVPGRVFSDAPLPWSALRQADADVQASIGSLRAGGVDYRNATGHLVLSDGVLQLDPASVLSPEGRMDFSAGADARQPAPPVALTVRSAAFALDPLLRLAGLPGGSDATAEVDVALHAAGASPHALASTLDGHAGLAVVDGAVSNAVLTALLADLLRSMGAGLDPGGSTRVRCLALRADAKDGQVALTALKLDTARLSLDGTGTLNLVDETVALRLRPLLRLGGAGVAAPLRLDGPWRHPVVALNPASGTDRVGVTLGGLSGPPDNCATELAAARDGHTGRMPADLPPGKPPKPADLLRSILR